MNRKTLIKKLNLTQKDLEEIKLAVTEAEKSTSGKIALAVAPESESYAFWELLAAVSVSVFLVLCLFPLNQQIYSWLGRIFWQAEPWYLCGFYLGIASLMTIVLYFLFNIPYIDSLIIPQSAKNSAVTKRAMRYFTESGVYCTSEHSGVLIFVSYFEKQLRIIADKGLTEKISKDLWNLLSDELSDCFAKGNVKEGFLNAVEKCSKLLTENFPAKNENPNELGDSLVILEDEKWA